MACDRQSAATFTGTGGARLFGIVHEPTGPVREDVAVLLLSPGVKNRVAPHRLYNKLSTTLAAEGFRVLRFDFYGLGDSEGELNIDLLADFYRSVQLGRYVEDTKLALGWMQQTFGCRQIVVGGLCGGALTGLLATVEDGRIAGVFGLGIPVPLDGSGGAASAHVTVGQLRWMRAGYVQKLADPASWLRFLTFKTDYKTLVKSLVVGQRGKKAAPAVPAAPSAVEAPSNTNPYFAPALLGMLSRNVPALLIFSGADRLAWEFEEKFRRPNATAFAKFEPYLATVHEIPHANHVLTFREWQQEAFGHIVQWLDRHFPRPAHGLEEEVRQPGAALGLP